MQCMPQVTCIDGWASGDAAGVVRRRGVEVARGDPVIAVAQADNMLLWATASRVLMLEEEGSVVPVGSKGHQGRFGAGFFRTGASNRELQVRFSLLCNSA